MAAIARPQLSDGQAMRVNAAVARNSDPTPYLTPKQRRQLNQR